MSPKVLARQDSNFSESPPRATNLDTMPVPGVQGQNPTQGQRLKFRQTLSNLIKNSLFRARPLDECSYGRAWNHKHPPRPRRRDALHVEWPR